MFPVPDVGGSISNLRDRQHSRAKVRLGGHCATMLACDPRSALPTGLSALRNQYPTAVLFSDELSVHQAFDSGVLPRIELAKLRARATELGAREVLMHLPLANHALRSELLRVCSAAGLRLVVLEEGLVQRPQTRPARIDDLLACPARTIDDDRVRRLVQGKTVLVTGAGGSIGSVLSEEIARYQPAMLLLLDQSEYSLYRTDEIFARRFPGVSRTCVVADVRRQTRMEQILEKYRPGVVFHAAAYKHVPLLESHNAWEAVRNNVLGTEATARAAMRAGVDRFILVSTDKAVNPVSVMGVSKRMAEMVCQALQQQTDRPCFEIVRFGNVIGSAGSVLPLFGEQLRRGDRLTVTHPDMRRYFMSVTDAARLLLQAATMGEGGEVFVMDMGEPIRVLDVARDMLRLSGVARPDDRIDFVGLRPGERLFEELLAPGECTRSSEHPGLFIARARSVHGDWLEAVMKVLTEDREPDHWRSLLKKWVPEYLPQD